MRPNKYIAIAVVLICLLATGVGVVKLCRYYLPQEGTTCALFERYKDNPYVKACLLRDFHVNDTLSVDALLLEATTDSAWCALMVDYGIPEEMVEIYMSNNEAFVGEDKHSIIYYCIDKNDPQKRVSTKDPNGLLVLGSFSKRTLCVFMTGEKSKKDIISLTEINKLKQ